MTTDETLRAIPHADLVNMLRSHCWYSGGRPEFENQGYSFEVQEETALRDVNYRAAKLHATVDEALVAYWERHHHDH